MARAETLTIDLDSLTADERATVRAVAAQGGVDASIVDFADPPVPVLAGLIFVQLRRAGRRVTADRCVRLALAAKGGA
jgi:hypothetical protein